jgi:hypothetical protein
MRIAIIIITLATLTSCAGVKEVTIEKRSTDFSLCIYRRTGKVFFVGHGGFFIKEQSKYTISLPDDNGLISFDKIKIEKNAQSLKANGGTIRFLDNRHLVISLTKEIEGKTVDMEINGSFKIE